MGGSFKQAIIELAKDKGIDIDVNKLVIEWPDLSAVSPWVSVNDRLPDADVVVALHGGDIDSLGLKTTAGYWDSSYSCFAAILDNGEVELCDADIWMPLPEPPKQ